MKAFQVVVAVLGLFTAGTGLPEAVLGPSAPLPGSPTAEPTPDSDYRFFAVMRPAIGLMLLSVAPRVREATTVPRFVSAAVSADGMARVVPWPDTGRPRPMAPALPAVELTVPPVPVVRQRRPAA